MKFSELKKELNNKVARFYIIKGDDAFLRTRAQQMIENRSVKTLEDLNITRYNDENYNIESILTDLSAMPMMSDFRVVVLKDLTVKSSNDIDAIHKLLDKKLTNNILIINDGINVNWYKPLMQDAVVVDCGALDETMLQRIALKDFQNNGVSINADALQNLIRFCNCDMGRISNEVNKLSNYVGKSNTVTNEIVKQLVTKDLEYNIFELSNAVAKKDGATAIGIVKHLLNQKESSQVLLMMILSNFRRMFFAVITKDSNAELAKKLGTKEYAIKIAKDLGKRFGAMRLKNILEFGAELDYKIKSGAMTADNALYFFITNISL